MLLKHIGMIGIAAILIFLFCIPSGCSREEKTTINKDLLLNESRKPGSSGRFGALPEKEGTLTLDHQDEQKRKAQMRTIDECQKEFELCVEKCGNNECEEWCIHSLSDCEKGLPKEIQTLKQ